MFSTIRTSTSQTVAWGDGLHDNKERSYAMLPGVSAWRSVHDITNRGILLHDLHGGSSQIAKVRKAAIKKHKATEEEAFSYPACTAVELEALQYVVQLASTIVNGADSLQAYEKRSVSLLNLAAMQLNVHNNDSYLPLHVDNPRYDGFGVVLVTVALWGSADVILADEGDPCNAAANIDQSKSWAFELQPGQMYVLCGYARNKCSHGVVVRSETVGTSSCPGPAQCSLPVSDLSDTGTVQGPGWSAAGRGRVSLTLRFGVHTGEQAYQDIDRHWG
jgi:hypothetical protein